MQNYVSMMKNLVQFDYQAQLGNMLGGFGKTKDSMIKIDKAATISQARTSFNESQLDPNKCAIILRNLIYLFSQRENFTKQETDELFFSMTKLFQTQHGGLKRILYSTVKQMRDQPSIYIITSSLLKDIHHKSNNFRRNSLRTIPLVLDPSNLVQVQRYIKALIGDKDPGVSSAALLSGIQMFGTNEEMVRKWGVQIAEKTPPTDPYAQYHTLVLMNQIKRKDQKALRKYLFSLMNQNLGGIALVQLLRSLRQISKDIDYASQQAKDLVTFVLKQARNKQDSVVLQAAKLACQSPLMSNQNLTQIIKILETYLTSKSNVMKYTVLKIYNNLLKNATRKSLILNVKQIQKVLTNSNTSLSSIAASLLLRICTQGYLERLFKQISKTMQEMSIDYKLDVIRSLINVLKSYPKKYDAVNQFLLQILTKQENIQVKAEIIKVMEYEIQTIGGQAKADCIKQLSKYLSSANNQKLHFQILGIISRQSTQQNVNSYLLKNLISEAYLQEGPVRACAVSTIIKVSKYETEKKGALMKTIEKFKQDNDQEVKARIKAKNIEKPISEYQLDLIENYLHHQGKQIQNSTNPELLDIDHIQKWGSEVGHTVIKKKVEPTEKDKQVQEQEMKYGQIFANHPTFKNYGKLRKINNSQLISDNQAEILANIRVFLFDENILLEYCIQNSFTNGTQLEDVRVQIKHSGQSFKVQHIIPVKLIKENQNGNCYVGLVKTEDCQDLFPQQKISSLLKFTVKQYSGETLTTSYQDQFSLEDFDIKLSNYMSPWVLDTQDFQKSWEELDGHQDQAAYQLNFASTQAAMQQLIKRFGIYVVQTSQATGKSNAITIHLAGKFLNTQQVLLILMIGFDTKTGCLLKIKAKTKSQQLTDEIIQATVA